jgi:hypothetical protein
VDEKKLEDLTKSSGPDALSAGSVPVTPEAAKDLSKADEKLSSLLGGGRPESGA